MKLLILVDYKEFHGEERHTADVVALIAGIPSTTLINYISGFSVNLYLNENNENSERIQIQLLNSLIAKAGQQTIDRCKEVYTRLQSNRHKPVFFFSHTNLLFYDLIFTNYNNLPIRDLSNEEAKRVFDAYLLLNSITTDRFRFGEEDIARSVENGTIEDIVLPQFIYQKDYASSTDFTNQIARGELFFQYLEAHPRFANEVRAYYTSLQISGYGEMYKNLLQLFHEIKIENKDGARLQLTDFRLVGRFINPAYLDRLCINPLVSTYTPDVSFSRLRSRVLYKLTEYRYFILDVNFLVDQFYKAQVFAFNAFLKEKGVTNEFLAIKAKEFTEDIYFRKVINDCFPTQVKHFGDEAKTRSEGELSDLYLREGNKIALAEFKDVLLNAAIKNNADKDALFKELDKKFFENQQKAPKGIRQLVNAITYIESNSVPFDTSLPLGRLEIFPILIYIDLSFGAEGINKRYNARFKEEIKELKFAKLEIRDFTFINLNFFEILGDYLKRGLLNFFDLLEAYHLHIQRSEYELTPFEVFARFYMSQKGMSVLNAPEASQELLNRILMS